MILMNKIYKSAPLPFQGQKRNFLKKFEEKLRCLSPKITTIVDLFGGSGLLSYTAKRICPQCEVIYNDFDDYHIRLEHIEETNEILDCLRGKLKDIPSKKRCPDNLHDEICELLECKEKENGFIDYITLSSALLFSMNYQKNLEGFKQSLFWNKIPKSNYLIPENYLDGLNIYKHSYHILFEKIVRNSKGGGENVLFLADPPYENTNIDAYSDINSWNITKYLNVVQMLDNKSYIYFTSSKSQLIEIFAFFGKLKGFKTPFFGAQIETAQNFFGYQGNYTDIMISRFLPGSCCDQQNQKGIINF